MKRKEVNSSRVPVYRDAGFELRDAETTEAVFSQEPLHLRDPGIYIYSRYRNPTVAAAEEAIMALEGSEWAVLTQSGMSAIDTAVSIFHTGEKTGSMLFFTEIYGGTVSYVDAILKERRGIDIISFPVVNDSYDLAEFKNLVEKRRPSVVYLESVSNPMLIVSDVEQIISISHKYGAKVIVDNTFATPWLLKPLEMGADIVIHSATKYLSGHGNLTAGVLCGNDPELLQKAVEYRKFVGHMLSPDDAYRLSSHLYSFELRYGAQCTNAQKIAGMLDSSPLISKVWYPGLSSHKTHKSALSLFKGKGFGAMITFDIAGESDTAKREKRDNFIKEVYPEIRLIPSLGDPHTILMPVEAVWGYKYPEPGMIRLSVGFEPYDLLEKVILRGFKGL